MNILLLPLILISLASCHTQCFHEYTIDEEIPATCETSGLTEGIHCEKCGEIIKKQEVIPALGHHYIIDERIDPTCEEDGLTSGMHCDRCDKTFINQETIPHLEHKIVKDEAIQPTCEKQGLTEGYHCQTCGKIIVPQEVIPALGHHYIIDERIDPTCEEDGLTSGMHCDRCNKVLISQEKIEHFGHTLIKDEKEDATCTKNGLTEGYHCATCGKIIVKQEIIPAAGHKYVKDNQVNPTCTKKGLTEGVHCEKCGEIIIKQESIEKSGHKKGNLLDIPVGEIEGIYNPGIFECQICHQSYYDTIESLDLNLPIVSIDGDLEGISKENKKQVKISYSDKEKKFEKDATIKWQGDSSLMYQKKNFNIQFYKDNSFSKKDKIEINKDWGKLSKYTLKANYIDYSQMRNIVSAKIYGDIVHYANIDDEFNNLLNGGAIDGFPVLLYQNGSFYGLYTLNTAKDENLFKMNDDSKKQAIIMGTNWEDPCRLYKPMTGDFDDGWELEYCSTGETKEQCDWIKESFNEMVNFINQNDGNDFINGIGKYIDINRTIDAMLFTWLMHADDNVAKNILWVTYDGIKWMPSLYDLDATWELTWDGKLEKDTEKYIPYWHNSLWNKIWTNMQSTICSRWAMLREGPLSLKNIDQKFVDFYKKIPSFIYMVEAKKWNDQPNLESNHLVEIINWAKEKICSFDEEFNIQVEEQIPYKVSFDIDEGARVYTYISSYYSLKENLTNITYSRDSETGYLTNIDGQTNFEIKIEDGYELDSIDIEGNYKNLKSEKDTGKENTYRITKISSDLYVKIKVKKL